MSDRFSSPPPPYMGNQSLNGQSFEDNTHAFIIRLWLEKGGRPIQWRGHITHVFSGRQRQVSQMSQIVDFISDYLHQMGLDTEDDTH